MTECISTCVLVNSIYYRYIYIYNLAKCIGKIDSEKGQRTSCLLDRKWTNSFFCCNTDTMTKTRPV